MGHVCPIPSHVVTSFVGRKFTRITSTFYGSEKKVIHRCLDSMRPQCPICRDNFSPRDIRKLYVGTDDVPSSTTTQAQRLLDDIAKTANGGATVEEMESVIAQCNDYHDAQPSSSVRDR